MLSPHGSDVERHFGSTVESRDPHQLDLPFSDRVKLLVVEDDPDTRDLLAFFFSERGYSVFSAQSGKQALDIISENPDLAIVLLDIFIPGAGGMEVLSEIRHRTPRPGVILLTALADREIAQDALNLGAFDYILKPFDLLRLESSVLACLAHNEYQKQSWWKRLIPYETRRSA